MDNYSPHHGENCSAKNQENISNKKRTLSTLTPVSILLFSGFIIVIIVLFYSFFNFFTPKLVVARYDHSSVLLKDGRILITGGKTISDGKSVILNSSEIYDPKAKKCILTKNNMHFMRSNHCSVLLPNGNVLIIGGGSQVPEIFDVKTETFYKLSSFSNTKDVAIAEKINDKQIIIVSPSNNIVEKFDIDNNKFKKIGTFNSLNVCSRHILNFNGVLFLPVESFNKSDLSFEPMEKVVVLYYDYKKNIIGNITKPQSIFDFCVGNMISEVNNKLIHFCSKNTLYSEIYDFKTKKFVQKSLTSISPKTNYVAAKYNDVILLAGGYKTSGPLGSTNSVGIYDSKANKIY